MCATMGPSITYCEVVNGGLDCQGTIQCTLLILGRPKFYIIIILLYVTIFLFQEFFYWIALGWFHD